MELYEVICRFLQTLPEFNDEFVGVVVVTDRKQFFIGQVVVSGVSGHPVLLSCLTFCVSTFLASSARRFCSRLMALNFLAKSVCELDVYLNRWSRMLKAGSVAGCLVLFGTVVLSRWRIVASDCKVVQGAATDGILASLAGPGYHPGMTELRLLLSLGALHAITAGEELVFVVEADDLEITIACDPMTMLAFRDAVQLALLRNLPAAPGTH